MKTLTFPIVLALTVFGLMTSGCKKDESKAGGGTATATGTAAKPEPEPKPEPKPEPAPVDDGADYVRVLAKHAVPKPGDPATINITKFRVVKADFDPATVEGGTAELELDLSSLASDSAKRDKHLRSADYLDVDTFMTATIAVGNVKKTGDKTFSADATVKAHGLEKVLPVTFEVLEATATGIKVHASHTFQRHDFAIGAAKGEEDSAADEITLELRLTLSKT